MVKYKKPSEKTRQGFIRVEMLCNTTHQKRKKLKIPKLAHNKLQQNNKNLNVKYAYKRLNKTTTFCSILAYVQAHVGQSICSV